MTAQDQSSTPNITNVAPIASGFGTMVSGPSFATTSSNLVGDSSSALNMSGMNVVNTAISPVIPNDSVVQPLEQNSSLSIASTDSNSKLDQNIKPDVVINSPSVTVNDSSNKTEKVEKESPLEALAKKLSQLKSEFIQTSEDEIEKKNNDPVSPTVDIDMVKDSALLEQNNDLPPVMTSNSENTSEISSPSVSPLPQPMVNIADSIISNSGANPIADTLKPINVNPVITQATVLTPPIEPKVSNSGFDSTKQNLVTAQVANKSDSAIVEDILKQYETELHGTPSNPNTPVNESTSTPKPSMSTPLNVPVIDNSVPAAQVPSSGNFVLNENDNAQVHEKEVELKSQNTKYPVSINKILDEAIERNASDVLISVGYPVMIRIDSVLVAINEYIVSALNSKELILPVLTEQKKELLEVNREVDLAYTHRHGGEARFRINAFYTQDNLAGAFRLIPTRIRTIEELNLPKILNQFINLKQGLILVTGPTGHGKSTTLAAMLQGINNTRAVHILTIEDPIEYIFPKSKAIVDQREMHDDTHSWDIALKSALRQNPDVILVGEMRDYETISSTITLAETGHLVFATLHTNSAPQTIDRIIDVFPENQQAQVRSQLSSILQAVVAQRLIPIEGGGRRAVCEIMVGTPAVNNLIREGKTHQLDNVIRTSADVGMNPLENSLVALVRDGLITVDEAQEYAVHPEEVIRLLKS